MSWIWLAKVPTPASYGVTLKTAQICMSLRFTGISPPRPGAGHRTHLWHTGRGNRNSQGRWHRHGPVSPARRRDIFHSGLSAQLFSRRYASRQYFCRQYTDPSDPKYIAIDCGIIGTLEKRDQDYLAQNMLAFFNRDYREVARLHVEWAKYPKTLASAISKVRFAAFASPSLRSLVRSCSAICCSGFFKRPGALTCQCSLSWYCCKKRCLILKDWAASYRRISIYG